MKSSIRDRLPGRCSICVVVLGIAITSAVAWFAADRFASDDRNEFGHLADLMERRISSRLDQYKIVLTATRGLFLGSQDVAPIEFHDFVEGLNIARTFPGLQAVGYTERIMKADLAKKLRQIRKALGGKFEIWPSYDRDEYYPIVYLEPTDPENVKVLGYDTATEGRRSEAMSRARDSGEAVLTKMLTLKQEESDRAPGFVMYLPYYGHGATPPTVEERRARLVGYVSSAFRARDFFTGLIKSKTLSDFKINYEVFDGDRSNPDHLFFATPAFPSDDSARKNSRMKKTYVFLAAGTPWTLVAASGADFSTSRAAVIVPSIGIAGLLITLLLLRLLASQRAHLILEQENAEKLRTAVKSRDTLMSVCSHELRTPITSMKLQTQTLLRRIERNDAGIVTPENLKIFSRNCIRQLEKINRLIGEMFEFSRLNSSNVKMNLENSDLSEVVRDAVSRLEPLAHDTKTPIISEIDAPIVAECDEFRIEQVVTNVLSNALKYGHGRPVNISLARDADNFAVIAISDSGVGVPADSLQKIFLPYERAATAGKVSGLGLGLYIANEIVKAHRGTISVTSEIGKGSTFTIRIPLRQSLATQPKIPSPTHNSHPDA